MPSKDIDSTPVSLIAGGAGFIASNLIPRLASEGRTIVVADNFSRGKREYVPAVSGAAVHIVEADLSDSGACTRAMQIASGLGRLSEVWHLAANSDIPAGVSNPAIDLKDTFLTTFGLLGAMRKESVPNMYFASSSAIYGDLGSAELHEGIGPLFPISNYGAMKLASEAQISAAAESHLDRACLFRFPNVVGVPATHGVVLDFVRKLRQTPNELQVLGDGSQQKAYLHVEDLVDAMLAVRNMGGTRIDAINIGPVDEGVTVRWIAEQVVQRVSPGAQIVFGSGKKGWIGDVPRFRYSTAKLQALGWKPKLGSEAALLRAIDQIACQEGV
jgi:UDP-glucose 4-epimerase